MKKSASSIMKIGNVIFYSILLFSVTLSKDLRDRRQANPIYVIDILVVVDDVMFSGFQQWMVNSSLGQGGNVNSSLKQYVSLIVRQANDRLATLKSNPSYQISLQIVDIRLNVDVLGNASKDKEGKVQSDTALERFRVWVTGAGLADDYDHAILLTGYPLTSRANSQDGEVTKGRSYVRQMCDQTGYSTTVIQESGGFQSVFFLVHELGHSLGAYHDETVQNCQRDRYIMSTDISLGVTPTNLNHPWYFSDCSTQAITSFVSEITSSSRPSGSTLPRDCLTPSSTPMADFAATSDSVSGQLYKADVQCQMIHGNRSRVCLGTDFGRLDQICTSMYCLNTSRQDNLCSEYVAAEGTSCGDKKWCKLGSCVSSASAPSMDLTKCPNGDSVTKINNKDCAPAITEDPSLCYKDNVNTTYCCASCEKIRGNSECPYGDKVKGCTKDDCGSNVNARNCCGTCSNNVEAPKCEDVSTVDEVTCAVRVTMGGRQGCYNSTVATSCCLTCSKLRFNQANCEYKNNLLGDACATAKKDRCTAKEAADCCYSCNNTGVTKIWTLLPVSAFITLLTCYNNVVKFL